jgi:transcriptional regulator GlxA family with amidase domain
MFPTFSAVTRLIAFVIFPDLQILDATGPLAAFEIAERHTPGAYALKVVATTPGPVRSSAGAQLIAEPLIEPCDLHTLIVAGGEGSRRSARDEVLLDHVRAVADAGRRVASVCSGAYVLAAAGILDGRLATTHWSLTADFARRFPKVRLKPDRIWTRDESVWTSAGISAGIDLALALIAQDLGEEVARQTARQLVVYHRRPGGQSQFSALAELEPGGGRFSGLLEWARAHLDRPLTVEELADRAAMSPRNFARAFVAQAGVTPAKAVERLRLEAARTAAEETPRPFDAIARDTGFGDPERMRRAFVRAFGHPPQALRRSARSGGG